MNDSNPNRDGSNEGGPVGGPRSDNADTLGFREEDRRGRGRKGGRRGGPPGSRGRTHDDDRGGPGGPRGGFGGPRGFRGGRARRGDVRNALLIALLDGPAHGYQLIQTIADRTGGRWEPSPGAVYPSLEALLDEGLATAAEDGGRRVFTLTDEGRATAESRREHGTPWERDGEGGGHGALGREIKALGSAARQVRMTGTAEQLERANEIVATARKQLYGILAES